MNKYILYFVACVFCIPYLANAQDSSLACNQIKKNACEESSLIRAISDEPLTRTNNKESDLKNGQFESDLSAVRKYDVLKRADQDEAYLTKVKKSDFLMRGQEEDAPLNRSKPNTDLVRSDGTDYLVTNKRLDVLERGPSTDDLNENRRNDELSRGVQGEPLSHCN